MRFDIYGYCIQQYGSVKANLCCNRFQDVFVIRVSASLVYQWGAFDVTISISLTPERVPERNMFLSGTLDRLVILRWSHRMQCFFNQNITSNITHEMGIPERILSGIRYPTGDVLIEETLTAVELESKWSNLTRDKLITIPRLSVIIWYYHLL